MDLYDGLFYTNADLDVLDRPVWNSTLMTTITHGCPVLVTKEQFAFTEIFIKIQHSSHYYCIRFYEKRTFLESY